MSSLTTIGVNKNKKGFAPKIAKRRERKPAGAAAAAGSSISKGKETTETTSIASETTRITAEVANVHTETTSRRAAVTTMATESKASMDSTPQVSSPSVIDTKIEPLTEEEIAMNAIVARPKRRRAAAAVEEAGGDKDQGGAQKKRVPQVVSAPSPISASSPMNAPSPIAPSLTNERTNCAFEQQTGPVLKIERLTPDVRSRLYASRAPTGTPISPKEDDGIDDYGDLLTLDSMEDTNEDVNIMDGDQPMSPRINISTSNRSATAGGRSQPETVESSTETTTTTTRSKPTAKSKPAAKSKPTAKSKPVAKSKRVTKPKQTAPNDSTTSDASPQGRTKRKAAVAAAVSIGIGIPSVASSSRISEDESEFESSPDSSSEHGDSNQRSRPNEKSRRNEKPRLNKRQKREKGQTRKPYKYAYREVENLRTLDDITNDPANGDYLEKSMFEFTKDIDGIVSKTFKELEIARSEQKKAENDKRNMSEAELAELKRKEEENSELEARRKQIAKEREAEKRKREQEGQILAESSNALQVRMVNGEIVLDTDTLTMERTEAAHDYGDGALEIVEENSMSRRVNSQTYGKKKQSAKWDKIETETFFDCLSQFGTDFEMISNMLPGRTRNQVRQKFNREEKLDPARVTDYLVRKRKPLDIEKYKQMAGIEELEEVPADIHEMTIA